MKNELIELAFLRNHLLSEIFTEEDKKLLQHVKTIISNSDSPFKEIALNAISNCEIDIEKGDFKLASNEINLIHNFRFNDSKTWNSNYFYKIEFPSYLGRTSDVSRIKKLIKNLANLQERLNI